MEQAFSDFDVAGEILDLYFPRTVFTVENGWLKLISQLIFFFSSTAGQHLASQVIVILSLVFIAFSMSSVEEIQWRGILSVRDLILYEELDVGSSC